MPSLTEEQWIAVQAEWMTGLYTDSHLAEKWGIDRKQIARRRDREEWKRDPLSAEVIDLEARRRVSQELQAQLESGTVPKDTVPVKRPVGRPKSPVRQLPPETQEQLIAMGKEKAVEAAINTIAQATTKQLQDAEKIRKILRRYADLAHQVLEGDEETANKAAARLFATDKDTLSSAMGTIIRMAEGAQKLERSALGIEDRKQIGVTMNGEAGGVVRQENGQTVIDATKLKTGQLEALRQVIAMVDGDNRGELPLPPREPE